MARSTPGRTLRQRRHLTPRRTVREWWRRRDERVRAREDGCRHDGTGPLCTVCCTLLHLQ